MTLSGLALICTGPSSLEVLIPLLMDDPLWDDKGNPFTLFIVGVLIPLLMDDPLWASMVGAIER